MLPEEMQVEDVLHHQCIDVYASTLSEFFFAIGCPFFWFEHLPPKMSVHVPVYIYIYVFTYIYIYIYICVYV